MTNLDRAQRRMCQARTSEPTSRSANARQPIEMFRLVAVDPTHLVGDWVAQQLAAETPYVR